MVALARSQHGLITRSQVLEMGGTDRQIDRLVRSGAWQRQRRGVMVAGAAADTWERQVMAACLAAGTGAVASHRSGARLASLVERCGQIQITVAEDRRVRLPGVEVHRSALLPIIDRATLRGVPVTTVSRTIVDLSSSQEEATLGIWVDAALRADQLHLLELRSCVARLAGPGRPSLATVRAVLAKRLPGYDPGDSNLEVRALAVLDAAGLPAPAQQFRVERPNGRPAFLDLAYPAHRVGIELDGWEHHGQRGAFDHDRSRRNDLTLLGWQIFNFTSSTTDHELESVVRRALGAGDQPVGSGQQSTAGVQF
ncbi:type IV toxin-antitoxin system AbiEi family antitoxin domain-containing protein [soil metagenome]